MKRNVPTFLVCLPFIAKFKKFDNHVAPTAVSSLFPLFSLTLGSRAGRLTADGSPVNWRSWPLNRVISRNMSHPTIVNTPRSTLGFEMYFPCSATVFHMSLCKNLGFIVFEARGEAIIQIRAGNVQGHSAKGYLFGVIESRSSKLQIQFSCSELVDTCCPWNKGIHWIHWAGFRFIFSLATPKDVRKNQNYLLRRLLAFSHRNHYLVHIQFHIHIHIQSWKRVFLDFHQLVISFCPPPSWSVDCIRLSG